MDPFHTIVFEGIGAKDDTEKSPGRTGEEWFLIEVGAAAGSEAEDGGDIILIETAAVFLGHRAE